MKELMNVGDILEEVKEAEAINCKKDDDIWTITVECGAGFTFYCCP